MIIAAVYCVAVVFVQLLSFATVIATGGDTGGTPYDASIVKPPSVRSSYVRLPPHEHGERFQRLDLGNEKTTPNPAAEPMVAPTPETDGHSCVPEGAACGESPDCCYGFCIANPLDRWKRYCKVNSPWSDAKLINGDAPAEVGSLMPPTGTAGSSFKRGPWMQGLAGSRRIKSVLLAQDTCTPLPKGKIPAGQWPTTQTYCDRCTKAARAAWAKDHTWVQWPCEAGLCDCTGGSGPTPVPPPPGTPTPKPVPAPAPAPGGNPHYDAAKTRFVGRWYQTEANGRTASWGARTFHLRFTGSTAISVMLTTPTVYGEKYYVCSVDGGASIRLPHIGTKKALVIKTGLDAAATHDVTCSRSNEAQNGETVFFGAILDDGGRLLDANAGVNTNQLRYEAIGDSITAGFKVYVQGGEDPSTKNEDVMAAYERHLADYWNTDDWRVVARSGIPVRPNRLATEEIVPNFQCRQYVPSWSKQCAGEWDFSQWTADVVTINLGTNDVAYAAGGAPTHPEFDNAYIDFVTLVREKYGPNTLIVAINPLVYGCALGKMYSDIMKTGIENAVKHFHDKGDDRVRLVNTGGFDRNASGAALDQGQWLDCTKEYAGDRTHPNPAGHKHFAELLAAKITPMIREVFPEKCGGTGSRCE